MGFVEREEIKSQSETPPDKLSNDEGNQESEEFTVLLKQNRVEGKLVGSNRILIFIITQLLALKIQIIYLKKFDSYRKGSISQKTP